MRYFFIAAALFTTMLLSGCSLLNEVNNTLEYANKATAHINTWQDFGQEAPQLIQDAASSPSAKETLEAELNSLLKEMDEFNQTEPPAIAEGLHEKVVAKNEELKAVIEGSMVNGELALEKLQEEELFTLISEISTFMSLVEELGH